MNFYNLNNISEIDIKYPDIYFTPEYGKACEYSDNAEWELCKFKDLIYVYLKRPIKCDNIIYYDLITPYGYSGYYYEKEDTFNEFINIFRKEARNRNYITEVVRQNPYIGINIENYDIITTKTIYGVEINDYNYYYTKILKHSPRHKIKMANKLGLTFHYKLIEKNDLSYNNYFRKIYNETMNNIKTTKYYYFNDKYFEKIENINNAYIIYIKNKNNIIIGSSIIFIYNKYIHYHLSCNDKSVSCITDILLTNVIKFLSINKLFILGGGLKDGDGLSYFKKRLSNKEYKYTIYKNILNKEIYDKLSKDIENNNIFPLYRKI
jgi:hypothetical protein